MRGVSLTNPVLALFLSGEFLLHIPCLLFISVGSLSYTSLVGFSSSLSLLSWLHFYAGISLTHHVLAFYIYFLSIFFIWGVSLTHPALALFFCGEFLLHIPCLFDFSVGSFSYTSRAGFIFMRGVSLERPVLALFLSGESLLHIPCLLFISVGRLSYTSRVGSLSPPPPPQAGFIFYAGSFLHPVLAFNSFIYIWEFLLHIPRWLYFSVGGFSYTSHACLMFLWGVSLTHPMMAFFFNGKSFSYISQAAFIFMWGISLTHPKLSYVLCGEFLLHIPS